MGKFSRRCEEDLVTGESEHALHLGDLEERGGLGSQKRKKGREREGERERERERERQRMFIIIIIIIIIARETFNSIAVVKKRPHPLQ